MADLKKGDVVVLKSGGPLMTIEHIKSTGRVFCLWFKGTERYSGSFDPEAVEPAPKGSAPMVVT